MSPQFLTLSQVDFITVGTVGEPGQRTFYLQAAQGDLLISLLIEKEHAAALSIGIHRLLDQLGDLSHFLTFPVDMELREPIRPLFRVAKLGLGYDEERDALVIVAQAFSDAVAEEELPDVPDTAALATMDLVPAAPTAEEAPEEVQAACEHAQTPLIVEGTICLRQVDELPEAGRQVSGADLRSLLRENVPAETVLEVQEQACLTFLNLCPRQEEGWPDNATLQTCLAAIYPEPDAAWVGSHGGLCLAYTGSSHRERALMACFSTPRTRFLGMW